MGGGCGAQRPAGSAACPGTWEGAEGESRPREELSSIWFPLSAEKFVWVRLKGAKKETAATYLTNKMTCCALAVRRPYSFISIKATPSQIVIMFGLLLMVADHGFGTRDVTGTVLGRTLVSLLGFPTTNGCN